MDIELIARVVVALAATSLLVVGLGVLVYEARRTRPEPIVHASGPLAAVNYLGIVGFVAVGLGSALTALGTLEGEPAEVELPVRVTGILLVWAAGVLAVWGLRSIGRDIASAAEVRPDTRLITSGAFGLVRHPLYLSILAIWAGGALALESWLMAILVCVLVPLFVARSRLEERMLLNRFGGDYAAYASHVPMLLPFPRHWQ